jgi:flagellar basal-body rod modification protein FlgD
MGRKKPRASTADAQDRFLKLLTTQLKNQDPLNPMDNAQMTSQLAQISTVDGIEKAQCHAAKAAVEHRRCRGHAGGGAGRASGDGGRQRPATDRRHGAVGGVELAACADQVVITIKDPNGFVIRTGEPRQARRRRAQLRLGRQDRCRACRR